MAYRGLYKDRQDWLDRALNSFATESFRDQADGDYIMARAACRSELFPQFLWLAHQAFEKYLKAILLFNRIPANRVMHDLAVALVLTERLPFRIELSKTSRSFIETVDASGQVRYLDVPYAIFGYVLVKLDLAVWELRRYCQVLDVHGKGLPAEEEALLVQAKRDLAKSTEMPKHKFRLQGGLLEKILDQPSHASRQALLWQNAVYGVRRRKTVRVKHHLKAQNPLLYVAPDILDELLKFVRLSNVEAYRRHHEAMMARGEGSD